jgi:hypothetical protein
MSHRQGNSAQNFVARKRADQRSRDHISQERPDQRGPEQHQAPPALHRQTAQREDENRRHHAADDARKKQQAGDRADRIFSRGQRLDDRHLQRATELGGRRLEERHDLRVSEETLRLGAEQRVAARPGDVGAVDLPFVDRVHRGGFAGVERVDERDLVAGDLRRLGGRDDRRSPRHTERHPVRHLGRQRADPRGGQAAQEKQDHHECDERPRPEQAACLNALPPLREEAARVSGHLAIGACHRAPWRSLPAARVQDP